MIAGTSAGAAVMGPVMITGDEIPPPEDEKSFSTILSDNVVTTPGLGFLPGTVVDQHFVARKRLNRLIAVCLEKPDLLGIGIDESTAILVFPNGTFEVLGRARWWCWTPRGPGPSPRALTDTWPATASPSTSFVPASASTCRVGNSWNHELRSPPCRTCPVPRPPHLRHHLLRGGARGGPDPPGPRRADSRPTPSAYVDGQGVERTRQVLDPDSYEAVGTSGAGLFGTDGDTGLFNYPFDGLVSGDRYSAAVGVVAFLLVVGGAFGIVMRTRAVETGILASLQRTARARAAVIPTMFILFSLGGAVFGMGEEAIAFAMVIVPVLIALGYDSIVGVLVTFGATQIGFGASWMNPFSVGIAQGIAGVPVMSGAPFRVGDRGCSSPGWGSPTPCSTPGASRGTPESSLAWQSDAFFRDDLAGGPRPARSASAPGHALVLLVIARRHRVGDLGGGRPGLLHPRDRQPVLRDGSGGRESSASVFRLDGMTLNDAATSFLKGARDLLGAALVVGMAKGIVLVLGGDQADQPSVLNTLLHGAGQLLSGIPAAVCAWLMLVLQSVINFFVVSGSGQAALTMPIMAPLADLVGVTRQVAILAFQLADGFTNLIVPTSGALIGTLGVARLDWAVWARFQVKFQAVLFLVASVVVVVAVFIGYQ